MAISAAAVAYCAVGGLVAYSGIKGATLASTAKAVLSGNLSLTDTETIDTSGSSTTTTGTSSSAASSTDTGNLLTVGKYLYANGYSAYGAAGIVACIYGESSGNPEAKGDGSYGLIQWQGSQYADLVTGNATADLDKQLPAIIAYNNAQGAGLIAMLNAQTSVQSAADFYSQYFERPASLDSDVSSAGVAAATEVYKELTS